MPTPISTPPSSRFSKLSVLCVTRLRANPEMMMAMAIEAIVGSMS
jgi:hypothetical protein